MSKNGRAAAPGPYGRPRRRAPCARGRQHPRDAGEGPVMAGSSDSTARRRQTSLSFKPPVGPVCDIRPPRARALQYRYAPPVQSSSSSGTQRRPQMPSHGCGQRVRVRTSLRLTGVANRGVGTFGSRKVPRDVCGLRTCLRKQHLEFWIGKKDSAKRTGVCSRDSTSAPCVFTGVDSMHGQIA